LKDRKFGKYYEHLRRLIVNEIERQIKFMGVGSFFLCGGAIVNFSMWRPKGSLQGDLKWRDFIFQIRI